MKVKRQKRVRRIPNFFKTHFNHRAPYSLLLDGTFCQEALSQKVNIKEQLPQYLLVPDLHFRSSACAISETDKLGPQLYGASLILKGLASSHLLPCDHADSPLPAVKCLKSLVKADSSSSSPHKSSWIVATQDPELRLRLRKIPGVPILYLHGKTPTLEEPSEDTKTFLKRKNLESISHETQVLKTLKQKELPQELEQLSRKRKRKGPNPLSCLKSKKKAISSQDLQGASSKRKRNRNNKKNNLSKSDD
uniref:rRNA-processing protein UTP23 homolog n=1 Tax=Caligus rogercresseyi TaxID=217165 RepID=C1BN67_CALRO|nr:C8orf53 [Caligus rogercresseyi]